MSPGTAIFCRNEHAVSSDVLILLSSRPAQKRGKLKKEHLQHMSEQGQDGHLCIVILDGRIAQIIMYIVPCSLTILIDGQLPYCLCQVHALLQHTLHIGHSVP